jgi:hypothetical protein
MKKILTVIILAFMATSAFSSSFVRNYRRKILLNQYRQDGDLERKLKAIEELSSSQDKIALKIFANDLAFVPFNQNPAYTRSGTIDYVRVKLAIALRKYKNLDENEMRALFTNLRKVVENDYSYNVTGETAITAALWSRKWDKNFKKLLVVSIGRRLAKTPKHEGRLIYSLIRSLAIINTDESMELLAKMLNLGYNNRINKYIKKILG